MDASPLRSPAVAQNPGYFRSMGATLGAFLGLSAMGVLYIVSGIPAVEDILHVRYILGPLGAAPDDGATTLGGGPVAWAVAPIAAGVAGFLCAPRTMAGRRWAGVAMGYLTYGIAILIAPLAVFTAPSAGLDLSVGPVEEVIRTVGRLFVGVPFVAAIGGVVLAPLLVVCAVGGAVWAATVRRVLRSIGAMVGPTKRSGVDGMVLLGIAVVLGLLWITAVGWFFGGGGPIGGEFVD